MDEREAAEEGWEREWASAAVRASEISCGTIQMMNFITFFVTS